MLGLIVAGIAFTQVVSPVTPAHAAGAGAGWYSGSIQYSQIVNCTSLIQGSPYTEFGVGTYASFYANPEANQPAPNQPFYVEVVVSGLGQPCSGGSRADINVQIPAGTSLAISGTNPVRCFLGNSELGTADCPQSLPSSAGLYGSGFVRVPSSDNANINLWPVPQGGFVTIRIPLVASGMLSNVPLNTAVKIFDGNDNPVLHPTVGLYVFSNQPSIISPTTSTTFGTTSWPTTIRSAQYLYPNGLGGNAYFDLRTSPGGPVVFTDGPQPVPGNQGTGYEVWADWTPFAPGSLAGGTTYYWSMRFVTTSGNVTYTGPLNSFTTPLSNQSVVGTGTAASCTGTALNSALTGPTATVTFNCGPNPVTIPMTTAATITNKTIDGANLVTLQAAPASRHLFISGGTSTVKNIAFTGGNATICGGSVQVINNATASFDAVRLTNNTSTGTGGALCVAVGSTVTFVNGSISANTAATTGGGVQSAGIATFQNTNISANSATGSGGGPLAGSGGGIFNFGSLTLLRSALIGNSAGTDGGGVANVQGGLTLTNSTVAGNTAARGGGVFTNNGSTSLLNDTISANTAAAGGGGGITSLGSTTYVRSSILTANVAGGVANSNCTLLSGGTIPSTGNSLDSANTCAFTGSTDLHNTDPQLLPLGLWGGSTRTQPPSSTSPAIDRAENTYCTQPDQTGFNPGGSRSVDGDGNGSVVCDMGAFEYRPDAVAPIGTALALANPTPTTAGSVSWTVTFSETVTGVDAADFALTAGGVSGAAITSVTPSTPSSVFTVTASTGSYGGTLRLDLLANDSIRDRSLPLAGTLNGEVYTFSRPAAPAPSGGGTGTGTGGTGGSTGTGTAGTGGSTSGTGTGTGATPQFSAIQPARLLDSRPGQTTIDGQFNDIGIRPADSITELHVTGRAGVPDNATAVVLNITATQATSNGYITVYPCGTTPPTVSNLNTTPGGTVPNAVITKIGTNGNVCIYTNNTTHLIADINGYYPA